MEFDFKVEGFKYAGTGDRDYGLGVVRISEQFLKVHAKSLLTWPRHQLVEIANPENGMKAICIFRPLISNEENLLCLEYDDRLKLGITNKGKTHRLKLSKAGNLSSLTFYWNHPNILVRIEFRLTVYLTVISVILGVLLSAITFGG